MSSNNLTLASTSSEIVYRINKSNKTLWLQVFVNILGFLLAFWFGIFLTKLGQVPSFLFFYWGYLAFFLLSTIFVFRTKIAFKPDALTIKTLYRSYQIKYEEIKDIQIISPYRVYFSIYRIILPFTQLLGLFKSGFINLILIDGRRIELPLLFDPEREKQALNEIRLKTVKNVNPSRFEEINIALGRNQKVLNIWVFFILFIIVCSLLLFALNTFDSKKQSENDEMVLPDGTKQFAYSFKRYQDSDFAEWAIYYPTNYSAGDVASIIGGSKAVSLVNINRTPCCTTISVQFLKYTSKGEAMKSFQKYRTEITGSEGDLYWYKKELDNGKIEIARAVQHQNIDHWVYMIKAVYSKTDSNENEIIDIVKSFELGYKNLKSNRYR